MIKQLTLLSAALITTQVANANLGEEYKSKFLVFIENTSTGDLIEKIWESDELVTKLYRETHALELNADEIFGPTGVPNLKNPDHKIRVEHLAMHKNRYDWQYIGHTYLTTVPNNINFAIKTNNAGFGFEGLPILGHTPNINATNSKITWPLSIGIRAQGGNQNLDIVYNFTNRDKETNAPVGNATLLSSQNVKSSTGSAYYYYNGTNTLTNSKVEFTPTFSGLTDTTKYGDLSINVYENNGSHLKSSHNIRLYPNTIGNIILPSENTFIYNKMPSFSIEYKDVYPHTVLYATIKEGNSSSNTTELLLNETIEIYDQELTIPKQGIIDINNDALTRLIASNNIQQEGLDNKEFTIQFKQFHIVPNSGDNVDPNSYTKISNSDSIIDSYTFNVKNTLKINANIRSQQ